MPPPPRRRSNEYGPICRGSPSWSSDTRSECQSLGPPVNLRAAVLRDGLDRGAGQRLVGREQPAQRLHLVEAAVEEQGERTVQAPDDLVAVEEGRGHAEGAAWTLDREQLAVTKELLDPAHREPQALSGLGDGQP